MISSTKHCPSGFIPSSSSSESLSSPTYSLRENREGELVSLTCEKVHWPQRPSVGKYSEAEEKKCRRKVRYMASKKTSTTTAQDIASDIIGPRSHCWDPMDVDTPLKSAVENLLEWAMKRSSGGATLAPSPAISLGIDPVQNADQTSSFILGPEVKGNEPLIIDTEMIISSSSIARQDSNSGTTISSEDKDSAEAAGPTGPVLGKCRTKDALKKLGIRGTAVVFEDNGKLQLALSYDQEKYILPLVEVKTSQGPAYGIASKDGSFPEVFFIHLEKLAHFYSLHPLTAFLHF